jgi:glycosyltransferase involved in cell wall biosynthesis
VRIIFDASNHTMYPIAGEGLTSGTVRMVRHIAGGLAWRGHTVHVITPDAKQEEQRAPNLWFWPAAFHPTQADAAVQLMHVNPAPGYDAATLVLMTFGCDPFLGSEHAWAEQVDAFPLLSEVHGRIMRELRPTIPAEKCFVTGLGVDLNAFDLAMNDGGYEPSIPGRLLYANDPARGLWHVLDIFDAVKREVPHASLHIAYDFGRGLAARQWEHNQMAQLLWECKRRIEATEGVVSLGAVSAERIVQEQLECQVHVMPSDPPNAGTQIHGLTQLECAAAGSALVLSDVEAFPEVFGDAAHILPVIGKYRPELERRITAEDYAAIVVELMRDGEKWRHASEQARALAEQHTWDKVVDRWEAMLGVRECAKT